jgi:undecaprenol kinase
VERHGGIDTKCGHGKNAEVKNRAFKERLCFAWSGLRSAWHSEASLRTQIGMSLLLLGALLILRPTLVWWALSGMMVTLVIAAELFNTALENLADYLHPEQHPRIKIVKDCAAAAVLILSIGALWVAVMMVLSVV